ncbi:DUF736 family protein [Neorhizobium sp. S3-V5DH]|uniref:DUF736 family protein n=1 Tax=Neorhizobium sp. S3-V5DH TaxID=2485166 RepID=UPI0010440DCF|nr:DUF736 family protein [Neorhizobium sp. S3-V5DH]TCV68697.1 uncharacterized protein DUF736 [Neorhizobium sp. S3-V5DH]
MATIGTFTRTENGFAGSVKTLTINVKGVRFVPIEEPVENGPVFRVFAGAAEFGAAWKIRANDRQRHQPHGCRFRRTTETAWRLRDLG